MKGDFGNKTCPGIKPGEGGTKSGPGSDPSKKTGMTSDASKKGKLGHGGKPGDNLMGSHGTRGKTSGY